MVGPTIAAQSGVLDEVALATALQTGLVLVVAAFAGGAFGAAIGALPALGVTGVLVVAGEVTDLVGWAPATLPGPAGPLATSSAVTGALALGPLFGPHVSFAGGAAAAAYATRKGYLDTDFEYYAAKAIARPLGVRPNVLAVGGSFGVLGLLLARLSTVVVPGGSAAGLPWDPIAFGVVLGGLFHRVVLGFPLLGRVRADGGVLDMSSFDPQRLRHTAMGAPTRVEGSLVAALTDALGDRGNDDDSEQPVGGTAETAPEGGGGGSQAVDPSVASGRLAVEPWQPRYYEWRVVAALGGLVGAVAALIALASGSAFLAFGLSAASLFGLVYGVEDVPVTHHVSLPASTAALAVTAGTATVSLPGLAVGTLFGVGAALLGEVCQRIGYAHADTHLDPAAAAILVATLVIALLAVLGVFPTGVWVPIPATI